MARDTLIGIFLDAVDHRRRPDQFMRRTASGWESISAERALADVESLALALREMGVGRDDRVALLAENRYEWAMTDLAVLGLGAVTVPIYPTLTAEQTRVLLEDCGARVAVVSTAVQLEKLRSIAAALPALTARISMDRLPPGAAPGERALSDVLRHGSELRVRTPGAFREAAAAVRPEDLATIIYTAGTTGEPKGAMLTHDNIAWDTSATLEVLQYASTDLYLSFLPLSHIFERMAGLYAVLACGAGIAYAESLDTVGRDALEARPTILCGVPRFYEKVRARILEGAQAHPALAKKLFRWALQCGQGMARAHYGRRRPSPWLSLQARLADRLVFAKVRSRLGGRLRFCVSGSAPLSPEVMEFFYAIGVPIVEGYGLTETSPVISVNLLGREKPGTVGPPIPGVEVKIGDEGEILTRGRHVMRGYYKNEKATSAAIRDGWFHTGDIGHLDRDGYLVITDRLKDVLVLSAGKKVAPQPIEARLKTSPWITEAILLGDKRNYVVCLIVPNFARIEAEAAAHGWSAEGRRALLDRPEVIGLFERAVDEVNVSLARFEQIKRFALLERELSQEAGELTPKLSVKRRVVAEKFAPQIEALYQGHVPAGV